MKYNKFIWIGLLFVTINSSAQDLYNYYESLWDRNDYSISNIEKEVDSIIGLYEKKGEDLLSIKMANKFSIELYKRKLYSKAVNYVEYQIALYRKLRLKNVKYAKALYNLGLFYSKIDNFENALIAYEEVVNINLDEYISAKAYCEIGKYYYRKGDFFRSNDYYLHGITVLEKFDKKKLLSKKYLDYCNVLLEIGTKVSLDKMLEVLDKADELFTKIPNYSSNDYSTLNNLYANYYNSENRVNFFKAKYYYSRILKKGIYDRDSTFICIPYNNLGKLYRASKNEVQRDSAIYFLNNGLRYANNKERKALVYYNFSKYYTEKNQYKLALDNIHKSLVASIGLDRSISDLPKLEKLVNVGNKNDILETLIQKATVLIKLYNSDKDIEYIRLALKNLLYADELVDVLLNVSKEEGSRLYWREEASEVYLKGLMVCEILNKKEKAFYFSEKKKALLLTEDIIKNTDKAKLPQEVLKRENELKKQIFNLENDRLSQKSKDRIKRIENKRFELKEDYRKLEDSLKIVFPEYYREKETTRIVDLKTLQEKLDKDNVIISYVSNKDKNDDCFDLLFAFFISKTQIEIIEIGKLETVEKRIRIYRDKLSRPFETQEDKLSFQKVALELFTALIPKDNISMSLDKKHLVIIPDGTLQYIPFESLVVDKYDGRYLIEDNEISYAYSMSFLQHNAAVKRNPSQDLITFAPLTFEHSDLENITNSINEVNAIGNDISLNSFIEKEASKDNFLSQSSNYKIIHLATHANFSANLQIAFHDSNLEYHELYTSKNQAELVVLSACNTSLGKMAKGEGVMSLARGFFYAGASTVISSLWNANDKSTAQIMKSFYGNLVEGQTKSKALHNAKINYLKSASLSEASPHYWATFILIGDSQTKLFTTQTLFYGGVFSFFLLLITSALIVFYKKR